MKDFYEQLDGFIGELYADGTVDRWKQKGFIKKPVTGGVIKKPVGREYKPRRKQPRT
jgi:hypothetical protein